MAVSLIRRHRSNAKGVSGSGAFLASALAAQVSMLMVLLLVLHGAAALNNGLARTPPMGWNSWNHFACSTDCKADPDNCISENLFITIADALVETGLRDAGYVYVNMDDCWLANSRDPSGQLQPAPDRFPHGIKYLSDYIHDRGLKFGIYEDCGSKTCEGFPGSGGHVVDDMQTFADWGVDYVKLDGCNFDPDRMHDQYALFSKAINATGRPMVFSCSWPAYKWPDVSMITSGYIGTICNLWRYYDDIKDNFARWVDIATQTAKLGPSFARAAGPGALNDPDMLEVGNGGQTTEEYRSHFSIWAILAAPLIMGHDVRNMSSDTFAILSNLEVIAVDQDLCVMQGGIVEQSGNLSVWARPLQGGQFAVVLFNAGSTAATVTAHWSVLGAFRQAAVRDLWLHEELGVLSDQYSATVAPHGVRMLRVRPVPGAPPLHALCG